LILDKRRLFCQIPWSRVMPPLYTKRDMIYGADLKIELKLYKGDRHTGYKDKLR